MKTCFHSHFYANFHASVTFLFVFRFSPKCTTKQLGMIYTILGSFCLFLNWEGADIRPQIRPRKIPVEKQTVHTLIRLQGKSDQGLHCLLRPYFSFLTNGSFHLCPRMDFLQTLHINNSLYTNYENVFIEFPKSIVLFISMICHLDCIQNTIDIILIPRNHLDKLWFTFSEEVIVKFQYFFFKNLQNIQHSIQKMDMF